MDSPAEFSANPLAGDLDHVLECGGDLWDDLRGGRLFIAGGTGFVGRWMLETLVWANDRLELDLEAVVLSRSPGRFGEAHPHLAGSRAITMLEGDMRSFEFPDGQFSHVLHMATETDTGLSARMPTLEFDTAVAGTRRILEFASKCGAGQVLYTSSGAVYGRQPADCPRVAEDDAIAPPAHDVGAAYAHGKRAAEFLCCAAHAESGLQTKIARLFAFVGPYLPLTAGYAVGNFIGDALAGEPIRIAGDGTPRRSYLYSADLAWWLWTILLRGEAGRPYNVGSQDDLSIRELAETVARVIDDRLEVQVAKTAVPGAPAQRYVPDTSRAARELGLRAAVSLEDGIRRTARWHENRTIPHT